MNAMKMIFSRMGRATSGDSNIEDISKAEEAYKSIGIQIREDEDTFRKVPDVLAELNTKWADLTDVQRSYISETSAGKLNAPLYSNI